MLFCRYLDPINSVLYSGIQFQAVKISSSYRIQVTTEGPFGSLSTGIIDTKKVSVGTNGLCENLIREALLIVFTDIMAQCLYLYPYYMQVL